MRAWTRERDTGALLTHQDPRPILALLLPPSPPCCVAALQDGDKWQQRRMQIRNGWGVSEESHCAMRLCTRASAGLA